MQMEGPYCLNTRSYIYNILMQLYLWGLKQCLEENESMELGLSAKQKRYYSRRIIENYYLNRLSCEIMRLRFAELMCGFPF